MNHLGPVTPLRHTAGGFEPLRGQTLLLGGPLGYRQERNATDGLRHGWRMLEAAGAVGNFELVASGRGAYGGASYADSDVFKWMEAAFWQRQRDLPDEVATALERAIGLVAGTQMPDGYVNTYVQVFAPAQRWSAGNPHEFYNLSHLIQAGVAAARSQGEQRLLEIAVRAADQVERICTGDANLWHLGHPGIEMALVELYRTTGEERYLRLASRLLRFRGERKDVLIGSGLSEWEDVLLPMPWDPELRGHAVCVLYLVAGMTDLLAELGEEKIGRAIDAKWDDMVLRKAYLTGNIGSRHAGEAVGYAYELPSGRAYCETCAGIAILMWCWRLLLLRGDTRYADYFEKVLYNAVFSGVGLDGTRFFYSNPLESRGNLERTPWYRCSCCPTNVMRLLGQLEHYVATQDGAGVQIQQYAPAEVTTVLKDAGEVRFSVQTEFPLDGAMSFVIIEPGHGEWALNIRRPAWCTTGETSLACNGDRISRALDLRPGYVGMRREWSKGDRVDVNFPMTPSFVEADRRAHDLRGTMAVVRGPLVYCAEGHDQDEGFEAERVRILPGEGLRERRRDGVLGAHVMLTASIKQAAHGSAEPLYRLYGPGPPGAEEELADDVTSLSMIPYYLWANRGRTEMRVWFDGGR